MEHFCIFVFLSIVAHH